VAQGVKRLRKILLAIALLLTISPHLFGQATAVALAPVPAMQFFSSTGVPLSSGCLYTYVTGSSTPSPTFVDGAGLSQNTNPTIMDAGGSQTYGYQILHTVSSFTRRVSAACKERIALAVYFSAR